MSKTVSTRYANSVTITLKLLEVPTTGSCFQTLTEKIPGMEYCILALKEVMWQKSIMTTLITCTFVHHMTLAGHMIYIFLVIGTHTLDTAYYLQQERTTTTRYLQVNKNTSTVCISYKS